MPAQEDFIAVLGARGLSLARVSGDDVADRERLRAAFREYVKPQDAERFGIKQPAPLVPGALVLVAVENHQQAVYLPAEVLTAHERRCLDEYLSALARPDDVPDIRRAERELRSTGGHTAEISDREKPLRLSDLAHRWHYTKQGIQKLARRDDFPRPCFALAGGTIRLWALRDIEIYERTRPELHRPGVSLADSEEAKRVKVRGFARARARGHG